MTLVMLLLRRSPRVSQPSSSERPCGNIPTETQSAGWPLLRNFFSLLKFIMARSVRDETNDRMLHISPRPQQATEVCRAQ